MSEDVNAVLGCSGDFYMYRQEGTIVYNGIVERVDTRGKLDTCFIDDQGALIFSHKGELTDMEQTQKFVDENNIRFSLSFGPIIIENGESCVPDNYAVGQITLHYLRFALCQAGDLHHYLVAANGLRDNEDIYPALKGFTNYLLKTGCEKAYTLGGTGYMEYYVQRHGDLAMYAYSIMGACLTVFAVLMLVIRWLAVRAECRNLAAEQNGVVL